MSHAPSSGSTSPAPVVRPALRWSIPVASRWALSLLLALSAWAKLISPYEDSYLVPEPLYYLGAAAELAVGVAVQTRWRRPALAAALLLAAAGIAIAAAFPGRLCGCFGSLLPLDGTGHVLLSGAVGALACLGTWRKGGVAVRRRSR